MVQKNNFILGDIFAVKEKGLDYLIENYYWPVSNKEFKEFVNFSHGEYLKIINSSQYEILDKCALDTINKSYKEFPKPKEDITIEFPINFELY